MDWCNEERLVEARGVKRKTDRIRPQPFKDFSVYRSANRFNHSEYWIRKIAKKKTKNERIDRRKDENKNGKATLYTLEEFSNEQVVIHFRCRLLFFFSKPFFIFMKISKFSFEKEQMQTVFYLFQEQTNSSELNHFLSRFLSFFFFILFLI